jgi:hypothetical protein
VLFSPVFVYSEPRRVASHPRRSSNSFLSLLPIPCLLSPNSKIPPAALSPRSVIPLSPLECALPDKHRVLPVFSRKRSPLSPLECALASHLVTTHSKGVAENANSFRMRTYKKHGGVPNFPPPALPCLPSSVHSSKLRIPQVLYLPLLRKQRGCGGIFSILELTPHPASPKLASTPVLSSGFLPLLRRKKRATNDRTHSRRRKNSRPDLHRAER